VEAAVNLGKHVKRPVEEMMLADESLLPTRARSSHVVGRYIKDRKLKYSVQRQAGASPPAPVILRLESLDGGPVSRERIDERIRAVNHRLQRTGAPFRVRLISMAGPAGR
jgi:hypothetical protein